VDDGLERRAGMGWEPLLLYKFIHGLTGTDSIATQ